MWYSRTFDLVDPLWIFRIIVTFLFPLQHPNISPLVFSTTTESGGLVIRAFQEKGTLRDAVCKCKPKNHFLKKYANPKSCTTLELNAVKIVGKQILEALKFLHEKGLPYGKICLGQVPLDPNFVFIFSFSNILCTFCSSLAMST